MRCSVHSIKTKEEVEKTMCVGAGVRREDWTVWLLCWRLIKWKYEIQVQSGG